MIFTIEAFDRSTDRLAFEVNLPDGCFDELAKIMGWSSPLRGDEGYSLTDEQLASIEKIAHRKFIDPKYLFQLTCNDF